MKIEEWRDVVNYEGYYQVSNYGRVRSLDRVVTYSDGRRANFRGRVIEPVLEGLPGREYYKVDLSKKGKVQKVKVHHLVACVYHEWILGSTSLVVDHIDNDRLNNRSDNLQIITKSENLIKDSINNPTLTGRVIMQAAPNVWFVKKITKGLIEIEGTYRNEKSALLHLYGAR